MYLYDKNRITYFAETDRRNKRVPFGIKAEDRTRHMYIIGKTGMGKSTLIENMVAQDIKNGEGFAFIDPHGKSAAMLLDYIPADRVKDVVYFAPFDTDNPVSFNVMEDVGPDKRNLIANGLMSSFKKIWGAESFSDRMQYILMNCLLALLEYPGSTLLGVNRMLTDKVYRKKVVDNIKDPSVRAYWVEEFAKYTEKFAAEATPAVQNKLGQFTSNPLIRNIIGQPHSSFDLRKMMDERKILIVNLSKGQLGEGNANLLGGMIISKIYLAAMSRADLTEGELKRLPNFYMYVDEFQSFANESFADILSEARKYKLALVVAHQYIKQMDEKVADAVFGNVGTQVMFRVGAPDAEGLEKEYAPVFTAEDMVSLGFTQIYLKLMIDGVASHPFSAVTLGPITPPNKSLREEVIASSRALYGHPRAVVEKNITDWYGAEREVSPTPPRPIASVKTEVAPPRPPIVRQNSNATFARPAYVPRPPAPRVVEPPSVRVEKTEKPFAQAFKVAMVTPPARAENEIPKPASLSTLNQARPAIGAIAPIRSKSPTTESLGGLKAALAGVLESQKKPSVVPPIVSPATSPVPPKEPQSPPEQKREATPPREEPHPPKPREVPEDVLTAILRGDD